jgi:hypothetical protein
MPEQKKGEKMSRIDQDLRVETREDGNARNGHGKKKGNIGR